MKHFSFRRLVSIIIAAFLIIAWGIIIFKLSAMDSSNSNDASTTLVEKSIVEILKVTNEYDITYSFPSEADLTAAAAIINAPLRKVIHATIYCVMAVLLVIIGVLILNHRHYFWICLVTALICFLFALTDEYHQTFVDGRTGQMLDVLIDTIGAFLGIIFASTYQIAWWCGKHSSSSKHSDKYGCDYEHSTLDAETEPTPRRRKRRRKTLIPPETDDD